MLIGARLSEALDLRWEEIGELSDDGASAPRRLQDRGAHPVVKTASVAAVPAEPHLRPALHVLVRRPRGSGTAARHSDPRRAPHMGLADRRGHRKGDGLPAEPPSLPDQTPDEDAPTVTPIFQNPARRQRRTGPRTPLWLRSANRRPAKTQPQRGREDQPRNPIMEMVRGTAGSDARKATKGTGEAHKPRHPLHWISTTQSRSGTRRSAGPHESRTDSRQRSERIASILGATST